MIGRAIFRASAAFSFLLLVSTAALAAEAPPRLALADLVGAFDQMILQGQARVSKFSLERIIRIKTTERFNAAESQALANTEAMIHRHTLLSFLRDDGAKRADILIERVHDLGSPGAGLHNIGRTHSVFNGATGELEGATIALIRDWASRDPKLIDRTMPHEMLHAIGFHGHAPNGFDSVMGSASRQYGPSEWDILFVKVLYDARLPVGMARAFALPIVCRLLNERLVAERNTRVRDLQEKGTPAYCASLAPKLVTANNEAERVALAWTYLKGLGTAPNLDEALRWAREAKAQNDPNADYLISSIEHAKSLR